MSTLREARSLDQEKKQNKHALSSNGQYVILEALNCDLESLIQGVRRDGQSEAFWEKK